MDPQCPEIVALWTPVTGGEQQRPLSLLGQLPRRLLCKVRLSGLPSRAVLTIIKSNGKPYFKPSKGFAKWFTRYNQQMQVDKTNTIQITINVQ